MLLGKTCRFCPRCELIIAHQDELESELARIFSSLAPDVIGNEYMVLGTVDRNVWRRGIKNNDAKLAEVLDNTTVFKKHFDLQVTPGGWRPPDKA